MCRYKTLMLIIFLALVFSSTAMANKFIISASNSMGDIIVAVCELQPDYRIKLKNFQVIVKKVGIYQTAVTFRIKNNLPVFDLYHQFETDIEQLPNELKMYSLDSNLKLTSIKEISGVPSGGFSLDIARFMSPSGLIRFLLMESPAKTVVVRELNARGVPGSETDAFQVSENSTLLDATVAEDGKMIVASTWNEELNQKVIHVRSLNPLGSLKVKQTDDVPVSLSLSDAIEIDSKLDRFLFYRDYRQWGSRNRIMMQKIDGSTGKFVGGPRVFAPFKSTPCYLCFLQSVAVSPGGNIVFYIDFDDSCRKNVLKAQMMNPRTGKKIKASQLIIGCNQIPGEGDFGWVQDGIYGIDIAQFEP
ncbi:hypothetical protein L0244_23020 [bacterium]|nr:hypothetical protein [bacterium]